METVPLELARIHRLIRPLRAALASLTTSTTQNPSRTSSTTLPRRNSTSGKGKGKALDQDQDYSAGSPFVHAKKKKPIKSTYGAKSRTRNQGASASTSTSLEPKARTYASHNDKSSVSDRLENLGVDRETRGKVLHLIKTYKNVLEACYPSSDREKTAQNLSVLRVPSLLEICASEVGWSMEEAVRGCILEAELEKEARENIAEADQSRSKREKSVEAEDVTQLTADWYEAVPVLARRIMLSQHATRIVIEGLEKAPSIILLLMFESCCAMKASAEASKFYSPLIEIGLRLPPPQSPFSCGYLFGHSLRLSQGPFFIRSLKSALLSSLFSERLFYSSFLIDVLESISDQFLEPCVDDYMALFSPMICEVALEMLSVVEEFRSNGDPSCEELSEAIVDRVARDYVEGNVAYRKALMNMIKEPTSLEPFAEGIYDLIIVFPDAAKSPLAPISILLELSILTRLENSSTASHINTEIHMSRLDHLLCSTSAAYGTSPSTEAIDSDPLRYFDTFVSWRSSHDFAYLSTLLHSSSFHKLNSLLLMLLLNNYDHLHHQTLATFVDPDTLELGKSAFEARLKVSVEAGLQMEQSKPLPGRSEGSLQSTQQRRWKYESMIDTYVIATPGTETPRMKKVDFRANLRGVSSPNTNINGTPLSLSSCRKLASGSRGALVESETPSKSKGILGSAFKFITKGRRLKEARKLVESSPDIDEGATEDNTTSRSLSPSPTCSPPDISNRKRKSEDLDLSKNSDTEVEELLISSESEEEDVIGHDLRIEILERAFSPLSSEPDDLDFLSFSQNRQEPHSPPKRIKVAANKRVKRRESWHDKNRGTEESEDELAI